MRSAHLPRLLAGAGRRPAGARGRAPISPRFYSITVSPSSLTATLPSARAATTLESTTSARTAGCSLRRRDRCLKQCRRACVRFFPLCLKRVPILCGSMHWNVPSCQMHITPRQDGCAVSIRHRLFFTPPDCRPTHPALWFRLRIHVPSSPMCRSRQAVILTVLFAGHMQKSQIPIPHAVFCTSTMILTLAVQ